MCKAKFACLFVTFLFAFCSSVLAEEQEDHDLKCNLKFCGAELLSFEDFSFIQLFRKLEVANFCVKECTPPVVHEFFEGIIFAITKRIPGHCSGTQCVDKNRFVALAKCVEEKAWPLLQCSKRLIDLAQVGLVLNANESKRNTTCSIVMETTQCIEEHLQRCGAKPFQLTKEIFFDVVKVGINAYCHPAYRDEGLILKRTTAEPTVELASDATTRSGEPEPHPQYVKGYRRNDAAVPHAMSHLCLFGSLVLGVMVSVHHYH